MIMRNDNCKVDFVIPWVDGADVTWYEKKLKYSGKLSGDENINRYRDWGTLKYWFRGVEKYAPWVNKVYLITDNQTPEWIDLQCSKLQLINHSDFIPSKNLPTFSSHPIELNMHRISALSEHFVYFNDDCFLTKPVEKSLFFKNDVPCDSPVLSPIIMEKKDCVGKICANNMGVINTYFQKADVMRNKRKWYSLKYGKNLLRTLFLTPWHHLPGFYNDHLPQPFLKSVFETVWEKEPELLTEVSSHKFRDYDRDVNQWLFRYWQFCEEKFVPVSPKRGKCFTDVCEEALEAIRTQKYSMICINDSTEGSYELYKNRLVEAFQSVLPEKSGFEK